MLMRDTRQAKQICQRIAEKIFTTCRSATSSWTSALARERCRYSAGVKEVETVAGQNAYWHYGQAVRLCLDAEDTKKSKATVDQMLSDALKQLSEAHQSRRPGRPV